MEQVYGGCKPLALHLIWIANLKDSNIVKGLCFMSSSFNKYIQSKVYLEMLEDLLYNFSCSISLFSIFSCFCTYSFVTVIVADACVRLVCHEEPSSTIFFNVDSSKIRSY